MSATLTLPKIASKPSNTKKRINRAIKNQKTNTKLLNFIQQKNIIEKNAINYLENALENYQDHKDCQSYKKVLLYASLLSSQRYGVFLEKFHFAQWGIDSIKSLGGDGLDSSYQIIEFKSTYRKKQDENFNLVQIRLDDNVDYFIFLLVDLAIENKINYHFVILNSQQMQKEVDILGHYAHGNAITNEFNGCPEYRISLNQEETKRWIQTYGYKSLKDVKYFLNN